MLSLDEPTPVRPPVMCGLPAQRSLYELKKANVFVSGDIGCYTLGASAPLNAMDTCLCMGGSVSGLHGFNKARGAQGEKNQLLSSEIPPLCIPVSPA